MSDFRRLTDTMLASPQISPEDIALAKELGVSLIICNRPDDEDPGQGSASEIAQLAADAEIAFEWIPVTSAGFSQPQVDAMSAALDSAEGSVLAYCRSGTRSTLLWSLARASRGDDPEAIASAAQAAGYDVGPVRPAMDMLAAQAKG